MSKIDSELSKKLVKVFNDAQPGRFGIAEALDEVIEAYLNAARTPVTPVQPDIRAHYGSDAHMQEDMEAFAAAKEQPVECPTSDVSFLQSGGIAGPENAIANYHICEQDGEKYIVFGSKERPANSPMWLDELRHHIKIPYSISKPENGWRDIASFSNEEKHKLRPIAEILAMLDGNAFFGNLITDDREWYESYLPEAAVLYGNNGGDNGWAGQASFIKLESPIADKSPEAASAGVGDVIREYIRAMANNEHIPGGVVTRAKELYAALSSEQVMTELTEAELSDHDPIGDAFGKGYVDGYKARAIVADQTSTPPLKSSDNNATVNGDSMACEENGSTAARSGDQGRGGKTSWTCPDCCVNPCKCEIYPMGDAAKRKPAVKCTCHNARRALQRNCPVHDIGGAEQALLTNSLSKENGETFTKAQSDWLPHNGGECPVPGGTLVQARITHGDAYEGRAYNFIWGEVIAYRIVKWRGGA